MQGGLPVWKPRVSQRVRRPRGGGGKRIDVVQATQRQAARRMETTVAAGSAGGGRGGVASTAAAPAPWRSREPEVERTRGQRGSGPGLVQPTEPNQLNQTRRLDSGPN